MPKKVAPVTYQAKDAAVYLGMSLGYLYDLVRRGWFNGYVIRYQKRILFRKDKLDEWMNNGGTIPYEQKDYRYV